MTSLVINGVAVLLYLGEHSDRIFVKVGGRYLGDYATSEAAMAAVAFELEQHRARRMAHSAA